MRKRLEPECKHEHPRYFNFGMDLETGYIDEGWICLDCGCQIEPPPQEQKELE